jgi:hypothetical protein
LEGFKWLSQPTKDEVAQVWVALIQLSAFSPCAGNRLVGEATLHPTSGREREGPFAHFAGAGRIMSFATCISKAQATHLPRQLDTQLHFNLLQLHYSST